MAEVAEPAPSSGDDVAIAIETFVREVSGQWEVELVVMFPEGAQRSSINTYRTKRQAEVAATWIKRGANRDIEGPRCD